MSDVDPAGTGDEEPGIDASTAVPGSLVCDQEGCDFSTDSRQRFGLHRWQRHQIRSTASKPKKDRRPRSAGTVRIDMAPKPNRAQMDRAKTEEKVKALLSTIVGVTRLMGEETDAVIIASHRDAVAAALAQLAEYEPWLKKLLSGGQASDRALAWIAAIMAMAAMLIPIADHHGMIPEGLKAELAMMGFVPRPVTVADSGGDAYQPKHAAA